MPAFNAEKYISESIKSVINQTYQNWELIVINDGSTDNTKNIVLNYANNPRIKYLFQQNGKQGKARNLGIANSTGSYIAFLDADDMWTKDKLETQIAIFNSKPEIDLIFSQGYFIKNKLISNFDIVVRERWDKEDIGSFIEFNKIPILSVLVKKNALLSVGNFPESDRIQYGEDYFLWLKLLQNNCVFCSIKDRLMFYRIHDSQITAAYDDHKLIDFYTLVYSYFNEKEIHILLLKKISKYLFNKTYHLQYFQLYLIILKRYNQPLFQLSRLISTTPILRLRAKLLVILLRYYK